MKKYFFLFCVINPLLVFAQFNQIEQDFNSFWQTAGDYYTAPLHFDSNDWYIFSAIAGVTAISSIADKEIREFSQKNQNEFSDKLFSIDKYYYMEFVAGSIVAFYGYGLIADDNDFRNLALKLTEATFLASSVTLISKIIIGRGRPYKQESQYSFNPFNLDNDYNSFPSGHTTLAFAYSTIMAAEVDNVFWKIGWYTLAGLVGYARIYHNQHWFSDVLMASSIGYFSGEFVNNHLSNKKSGSSVKLYPMPTGLAVQVNF